MKRIYISSLCILSLSLLCFLYIRYPLQQYDDQVESEFFMNRISIVIPAYNEEERIGETLKCYYAFFNRIKERGLLDFELLVVLNGCKDNTCTVVEEIMKKTGPEIRMIELQAAGKGLAIIAGFKDALERPNGYIGFVDADMATEPMYFYELYEYIDGSNDGVIASRYMPGSNIFPARPWIKEWGRKLIFNQLVRLLFDLSYADTQCGAKLFKRTVIESILPEMKEGQWAFDVELLYLAKKHGYTIIETPTVWYDKTGSKLQTFKSGMKMLDSLFTLKKEHRNK